MYQEIQLKKPDGAKEPLTICRRSAPQFTAMKEVKRFPHTADNSKGAGFSMNDMRIHYRSDRTIQLYTETNPQNFHVNIRHEPNRYPKPKTGISAILENYGGHFRVNSPSASVVQGKFKGEGAEKLLRIYAERYPDSTYSALFRDLDFSSEEIRLEAQWGLSRYDPKEKKLYLNFSIFQQLNTAIENDDRITISSLLSNICHELSHAYDFIGDGKKPPNESLTDGRMSDETFISTELRAWAKEAISILEINKHYGLAYNDSNKELIEGWVNFKPDMLDDLSQNKNNCIIKRLIQYLSKRQSMNEMREVQGWLEESGRKERYKIQLASLQTNVMGKLYNAEN